MSRTLPNLIAGLMLSLPLFSGGCATAAQVALSDRPAAFGGTRLWGEAFAFSADQTLNEARPPEPILLAALVDLPLSFVADLAMLPVTGVLELTDEEDELLISVDLAGPR